MADQNIYQELQKVLKDFKDFLDQSISTIQPAIRALRSLVPQIDVIQRPDAVIVRADLPGMNADDIDVSIEDGRLVISGERREERREEGEGFVRSEISYGTFYRTIPLPDGADENNIAAVFRNGVLEVTVPVSGRDTGRRVKVKADESAGGQSAGGRSQEGRSSQTDESRRTQTNA